MCVGSPGTCACLLLYLPFGIPGLSRGRRDPTCHSKHVVLQSFNIAALAQIIYRLCVNCIRLEAVTCRAAELQKETDRRFRLLSVQCSVPLALHVALVVAIILTATQRLLSSLGALLTN